MKLSKSIFYSFLLIATGFFFTACQKNEVQEELDTNKVKFEILNDNWEKEILAIDKTKLENLSSDLPVLRKLGEGTRVIGSVESERRGRLTISYLEGKGGIALLGEPKNPETKGEIVCGKVIDNIFIFTMKVTESVEENPFPYLTMAIRDNGRADFGFDDLTSVSTNVNKNRITLKDGLDEFNALVLLGCDCAGSEETCMDPFLPAILNFVPWDSTKGEVSIL